jgi:hypothetical protein
MEAKDLFRTCLLLVVLPRDNSFIAGDAMPPGCTVTFAERRCRPNSVKETITGSPGVGIEALERASLRKRERSEKKLGRELAKEDGNSGTQERTEMKPELRLIHLFVWTRLLAFRDGYMSTALWLLWSC